MTDPDRPSPSDAAWHTLSADAVAGRLQVDLATGLTAGEAERRAAQWGANQIRERRRRGPWRLLLDQFADLMIVILIGAAVVSGVVGEPPDAIAIVVIVVVNAVVGFVQEYRAERAVAALKRLAAPSATVRRDRTALRIPAAALVPGDVSVLEAGDVVPADLRLVEAVQLRVEEAVLTGESVPVEKCDAMLSAVDLSLGDRTNMAFKGTLVTHGRGCGVVVATGMATELGRIAALLEAAEDSRTPLQRRLAHFGQRLAVAVLAICAVVFATGLLRGEPVLLMFLTAVSLAVAAVPEALPAVVTVSLALGARQMVARRALIRRLPAVETLGSVTYICTDKTGTLTQNTMRVEQLRAGPALESVTAGAARGPWALLYRAMALSADVSETERGEAVGDPTELALRAAAAQAGYDATQLASELPRCAEAPFDSERKRMTTVHRAGGAALSFTKGAPEAVVPHCDSAQGAAGREAIDAEAVLRRAEEMAAAGLRVLAVASREWPEPPRECAADALERGLTFLGLVGLADPLREEAQAAVAQCTAAGIVPVMITGDHPGTARAIATRLGIIGAGDPVMTGPDLARLAPALLRERVTSTRVYARVAPEQKIAIVGALRDAGEYVAMTGDGVNDAPALKLAHIGIAMGRTGSDVARAASDMILLDDNFATIVAAVRAGRRIFDNIRKFVRYTLTSNAGEIWAIFLAPLCGLPIPLLPIHILWINLVTDGLPGLALAAEPEEAGVMRRPPRPPDESIFAHGMWQQIIWVGLLMGGVSLCTEAWAYGTGRAHWQTMVFTVLTLSQMGNVLALRSERVSLRRLGLRSNPLLLGAVVLTLALQLATVYVPALNPIFKTAPLSALELAACLALSSVVFFAVEAEKGLIRRGWLYREPGAAATASAAAAWSPSSRRGA